MRQCQGLRTLYHYGFNNIHFGAETIEKVIVSHSSKEQIAKNAIDTLVFLAMQYYCDGRAKRRMYLLDPKGFQTLKIRRLNEGDNYHLMHLLTCHQGSYSWILLESFVAH